MTQLGQTSGYRITMPLEPLAGARRVAMIYEGVAYGGTEEYILLMMRYLDRRRYSPIVVTTSYNDQFCPPEFKQRLRELNLPLAYPERPARTRLASLGRNVPGLTRLFREIGADVVHIHTQTPIGGRQVVAAARLAGVRVVLRSEHLPPSSNTGPLTRLMTRTLDPFVDYVIAGSDSCRDEQLSLLGRDPRKTQRIFYGIELDRFSPRHDTAAAKRRLGLDPAIPTVGKIARLSPEKGHAYLIDAAAKVIQAQGPVNFLLFGTGKLEAELRAQAAALGIAPYVHFLGFASDTVPCIEAMDITAMTSISEGISLAMLEYMAMGKPVVATREPSFAETIVDGESGLLVALRDPASIAAGLCRLLREPELARRLGKGAHDRVHAEFDIRANVRRFMELYDSGFTRRSSARSPVTMGG